MFKSIVLLLICFVLIFYNYVYAIEIIDIEGHWAEKDIIRLINNNCIDGYDDGTFRPDNKINVNEFIKIFILATKYKLVLEGEGWDGWYIKTAEYKGFIKENEFDMYNKAIKRNEVVNIISRYIDLSKVKKPRNVFKDLDKNNLDNVLKLNELGIIQGYDDKTFRGENTITRAEAAVIINRAIDLHRKQTSEKDYDLCTSTNLANINKSLFPKSNWFEYINGKIFFFDLRKVFSFK